MCFPGKAMLEDAIKRLAGDTRQLGVLFSCTNHNLGLLYVEFLAAAGEAVEDQAEAEEADAEVEEDGLS